MALIMWPMVWPPVSCTSPSVRFSEREAGVVEDPAHQREHDDVDGRAAEVDEPADRLHAALEDQELAEPHDQEADPAEGVEPHEACRCASAAAEGMKSRMIVATAFEAK